MALCAGALASAGWSGAASAALPDGRDYELVSPAHKSGGGIGVNDTFRAPRATPDGKHMFFQAVNPLPGSVEGVANKYRSDRGDDGWSTVPLMPTIAGAEVVSGMPTWLGSSTDGAVSLLAGDQAVDPRDQDFNGIANAFDLYLRTANGDYIWVTKGQINTNDPGNSIERGVLSADGRHVVFESATALLPEDAARTSGMGLYDWSDGTLRLVAVDGSGALLSANGVSFGYEDPFGAPLPSQRGLNAVSEDGSKIFFTVDGRLYVRVEAKSTVSVAPGSAVGTQKFVAATPDGEHVFFTTTERLTDDDMDNSVDLYRFDLRSGALTRISSGSDHQAQDAGVLPEAGVRSSDDGQRVFFSALGSLAPGATTVSDPETELQRNLYMVDHGATRLIAEVRAGDLAVGPGYGSGQWRVSEDGSTVVFRSAAALTPDDADEAGDIYAYRLGVGLLRVSGSGAAGNDGSVPEIGAVPGANGQPQMPYQEQRVVSHDGHFIFFQTVEGLVPQDANGRADVYRFDTSDQSVALISSGVGAQNAMYLDSSASGADVFFATFDALAPQDVDDRYDVYDARIDGGFPVPLSPAACGEDDCQGPAHGVSESVTPASQAVHAPAPPPTAGKRAALTLGRISGAQRRRAARTGRLNLRVRSSTGGTVSIALQTGAPQHRVNIGAGVVHVKPGVSQAVRVTLKARARRSLRRHGHLNLTVRAVLVPGHVTKRAHVRLVASRSAAVRRATHAAATARNR